MHLRDLLALSAKNVLRAGVRTLLCTVAICIGITSVSTVGALGSAAGASVQEEMDRIGIRGIVFYPKSGESVSQEVLQAIGQVEGVTAATPMTLRTGSIRLRTFHSSAGIIGIDEGLSSVFHLEVLHGALPQKRQVEQGDFVAVIDADLAKKVYKRTNVVGKDLAVTMNGITETMTICAVIQSQSANLSALLGGQLPYLIYLPHTALNRMVSQAKADKVIVAMDTDDQDALAQEVVTQLSRKTGEYYQFENLDHYLKSFTAIAEAMTLLISGIAVISVIVGGIGVMNAMISAVDVRIREVGIYRALGAKKQDIIHTFLLEAILLCLMGGCAGIGLSWGIFQLLDRLIPFAVKFQWKIAWSSLGISGLCGAVFGILPALRAASLDPIQAIRSE